MKATRCIRTRSLPPPTKAPWRYASWTTPSWPRARIRKWSWTNTPTTPETGIGHAAFQFTEGAFRSVTGAIVDHNPEAFQLSTPLSDIGIRGTTTAHYVPGPDSSDLTETHLVLVYDGKPVAVSPRVIGGEFRLIAESGGKVLVGLHETGQVQLMTRAEFEYYQQFSTQNLEQQAPAFHSPEELLQQYPDLDVPVTREDLERAAEQARRGGRGMASSGRRGPARKPYVGGRGPGSWRPTVW